MNRTKAAHQKAWPRSRPATVPLSGSGRFLSTSEQLCTTQEIWTLCPFQRGIVKRNGGQKGPLYSLVFVCFQQGPQGIRGYPGVAGPKGEMVRLQVFCKSCCDQCSGLRSPTRTDSQSVPFPRVLVAIKAWWAPSGLLGHR